MTQKSRPFSIYLLKQGFDAANALVDDHGLLAADDAAHVPEGSTLYILDERGKRPWWREYFGVQEDLWQQLKGALLFLPVGNRCFALSFGHVLHHVKDDAYEYDFGLRVTLNSLDPQKLKSADMIEPGPARRRRTQVPISTELTYLDFDGNSEIIKSLTGRVKEEYKELFTTATGSASLKISMKIAPGALAARCETLLALYGSEDYKTTFPNIQNIIPVKDPVEVRRLDALLLESVKMRDGNTMLTIPDIVDYRDNTCCMFNGPGGASEIYPDISIEAFYDYLGADFDLNTLTLDQLKSYRMLLTDVDGAPGRSYGLYRSLIFDTEPADERVMYHLNEGDWYKAEKSFLRRLKTYLDAKCEVTDLCPYDHDGEKDGKAVYSEGNYNAAIPVWQGRFICLDQADISPDGSTNIEPCDLYSVLADANSISGFRAALYHLKISTRSSHLSHLFNQGVNSIELIELEETSRDKLKRLVVDRLGANNRNTYLAPVDHFDFKVVFGIITHKDPAIQSDNLPLFSKISLMRNMQRLDLMKVPSVLTFIEDASPAKGGHAKNPKYLVQVYDGANGHEVRAVGGQGLDTVTPIKRCPKAVRDSAPGTRYHLTIRVEDDGSLCSHHSWPFDLAA
ncbi:hypothetical protein SIAM614_15525 [Stappia aggregata IAM 12614]|uniref:Sporadically distributed protein, TIGR04141 family n=1 Tax=Roseibium aggregatum (strain ATCC 25650 / DSM 13394 / JCM 20685 / NBRC 16684 / NCIMB 2208 / IAM 12614 / B1) TaxID=384765 RepID=A0NTE0_ROSAI|nr:DUF6119 family protein [Roseibium aggregatum]EAV44222.1 hypothetical protein SIAM614_15525 [Stappia aggregata IAM 12614] [Roseibium aggregatum IAM 12614]